MFRNKFNSKSMIKKNYLMALAVTCLGALASGCNSNGTANVAGEDPTRRVESFEEGLDYLKVDKKERAQIDSLVSTELYASYAELDAKCQELLKTMSAEEVKQTEVGKSRDKAFSDLVGAITEKGMSSNALAAVLWKVGFDNSKK